MSDISSFSIQNPKQIISHLSVLLKNKSLIRVRFGVNNESYITTLLGINEKNNTVVLDCGSKENLNNHIQNASKVNFETEYKGIKVSFAGAGLKKVSYQEDQVFIMPIPKTLFWMERREYFRVKIPLLKPSYCQLQLKDKESINIKLHGISLSGFSMFNERNVNFNQLISGAPFEQGKLILSEVGEEMISFEVRYSHIINPDKLKRIEKIGCKFMDLSRCAGNAIQSYMQKIQRDDLQEQQRTQIPEQAVRYRKILIYINDQ